MTIIYLINHSTSKLFNQFRTSNLFGAFQIAGDPHDAAQHGVKDNGRGKVLEKTMLN
jgi:hypothetical protein